MAFGTLGKLIIAFSVVLILVVGFVTPIRTLATETITETLDDALGTVGLNIIKGSVKSVTFNLKEKCSKNEREQELADRGQIATSDVTSACVFVVKWKAINVDKANEIQIVLNREGRSLGGVEQIKADTEVYEKRVSLKFRENEEINLTITTEEANLNLIQLNSRSEKEEIVSEIKRTVTIS